MSRIGLRIGTEPVAARRQDAERNADDDAEEDRGDDHASVVIVSGHSPIMSMKQSASECEDSDAPSGDAPGDQGQGGREHDHRDRVQKARQVRPEPAYRPLHGRKKGRKFGTASP